MAIALVGLEVKIRGQGQISKVKVKVYTQLFHTSTATYDYGRNQAVRRVRVSVRNAVGGTSVLNRGQFSSVLYL